MNAIRDFTWLKHLRTGRVLERFTFEDFRAVSVQIPVTDGRPQDQYRYRMLFFPEASQKPVLSLNLELSILGSYCLTEQSGDRHLRFDTVDDVPSYDEFRSWAIDRAAKQLQVPEGELVN